LIPHYQQKNMSPQRYLFVMIGLN